MSSSLDYYCVGDAVCDEILGLLSKFGNEAIAKRGIFRVGVSGGSIADILAEGMYDIRTDFTKWQIFFCDERIVPVDMNCTLSPTEAAADYEKTIRKAFNMENTTDIPSFDLLILGIGPDGHTASLFPGHPLLDEKTKLIAAITDSPKPPPNRVTMTYPLINNAKICMFGAQGQSKAEVLKRILVDKDESLPVTRVDPKNGELIFIACDEADSLIDVDPTRKAKKG
ncbi:6-phosphogluconolactonase-like isoform X2 [Toxorhynchites rutilus septentrionalis]|uniref:6-phosphogluconolactonase-like isoform X2 n=1 Tax=Toxorhynchites rutilus septentrionalis TaxID=329112 RepID=UPI0024792FBC|nr:6-phosphogluconolactonase-like isoform X2 [Toxorhynchites rutilus septentrionalis]